MKRFLNFLKCYHVLAMALLGCLASNYALAYDFSSITGGDVEIFYSINPDGKSVTVTYGNSRYECDSISIPREVHNEGNTYTVTAIGVEAFMRSRIRGMVLPNTIEEIQKDAFFESNIMYLNYPKNLKYIRWGAFRDSRLRTGNLPENLSIIEACAFAHTNITSLYLPASLTKIGEGAFGGCNSITSVVIPGSIKEVESSVFSGCNELEIVEMQEGIEEIGSSAFAHTKINDITFPSTLTKVGSYAFESTYLTQIVLPNTIKEIGQSCFSNSYHLESITFPEGLEYLPEKICYTCPRLIKVIIPNGVKSIGDAAFRDTPMLSHITLPESVTEVGLEIFCGSGLVSFSFPQKLQYINYDMFRSCQSLLEIVIPETIKEIRQSAFEDCTHLRKAVLPEALEYAGEKIFYGCSSLEEINIPANIKTISKYMLWDCKSITSLVIPEGIEEIEISAFLNCESLKSLQLPKSLTTIWGYFIAGCKSLKSLTVYHNVSGISQAAFIGCNLDELHFYRAVLPKWVETTMPPSGIIDENNNCTLYVPSGSVDTYKASPEWNVFKNIVGEDVTEMLNYQISFPSNITGGNLIVNGEDSQPLMEFAMGSKVEITPIAKDDYSFSALLLNDQDVTADMINGTYIIENLDANYRVEVKFTENPVILSLLIDEGGSIDVEIEKGQTFTCLIKPEKAWKINTVTFNGNDVTGEVTSDNRYVTPALYSNSELRVTFESLNGVEFIKADLPSEKVYVNDIGVVTIEGLEAGTPIMLHSIDGILIDSTISCGNKDVVKLPHNGIYLIQTSAKTYKIHY